MVDIPMRSEKQTVCTVGSSWKVVIKVNSPWRSEWQTVAMVDSPMRSEKQTVCTVGSSWKVVTKVNSPWRSE